MTRRFTERESPFGGRYWEDQDGNKIHEREGPFGGRYYEDADGNKIQDLKGPFGGRYADDGEGHRTSEHQGLLGSTFEDREGNRTRVVEEMFGGRTVETDSPAPLFPQRPAATKRFQLPRIRASSSSDDGPASLVGCLFLAVIAVVVLAIALYIGLPILIGVLLAKFVNRRYVEPQAERHRWRWAILPAAFAAGALPTNELVATGFGALQCSEPQSRSCAEYRQSPTPTVLGLHRWWIQNGQPMGQRPGVPNEAPEIAHLVARDPQARINLRKGPSATAESGGYGLVGDQVQLVDTAVGADGNSWSFVRFKGSGAEGWIRSDYVEPTANATSPAPAVRGAAALDQGEAVRLIERWLAIKPRIFAPPYDTTALDGLVGAGPLRYDITKTNGSIDWLRQNNSSYSFSSSKLAHMLASDLAASPPSLVVNINEVSTFNGPKGNKQSSTSAPFIYSFILEDGRWLIHDVRRQ